LVPSDASGPVRSQARSQTFAIDSLHGLARAAPTVG
jgi:hypothetical protein